MGGIPRNIRIVIAGLLPLVALIILTIFASRFGLGKISEVRAKVTQGRSDLNILQTKLNLLQDVQATVSTSSSMATVALPSENPVLTVLTQLKNVASQGGLTMENVKTGSETKDESGLSRVAMTFDVSGGRAQVFQFMGTVTKIAPISVVDKVKLNESGGSARATITVKSFWADLPTKLPAINQEISDLTADERKVITDISALIQPASSGVAPGQSAGKSDPFSF